MPVGQMEKIKQIREDMAAGVMDVKRALEDSNGDVEGARRLLEERGQAIAWEKADRETTEGLIDSYVHFNGRVGVLLEVGCETDFVARTPEFKGFCRSVALHIASMRPVCVSPGDIPAEMVAEKRGEFTREASAMGKPKSIQEKIVEGRLEKWISSQALLTQPYVKEPEKTVGDLLHDAIRRLGENVLVRRFVCYEL